MFESMCMELVNRRISPKGLRGANDDTMMDASDLIKFLLEDEESLLLKDGKAPDIPWFSSDLMCFTSVDPFPHAKTRSKISHDTWEELNIGLDDLILRPERKARYQRTERKYPLIGPGSELGNGDNLESKKGSSRSKNKDGKEDNSKSSKKTRANADSKAIRESSKASSVAKSTNISNDKDKKKKSMHKKPGTDSAKIADLNGKSTPGRHKEDGTKQKGEKPENTRKESSKKRKPKRQNKKNAVDMTNSVLSA